MARRARSRLGVRVAVPATAVVVVLVVALAALQYRDVRHHAQDTLDNYSELVSGLVQLNLREAMVANDRARLTSQLADLATLDQVRDVRVVNKSGEVVFATDPASVGTIMDRDDPSCQTCHQTEDVQRRARTLWYQAPDGQHYFRAVQPIVVEPACVRCHEEPRGSVLAVLITDLNDARLTQGFRVGAERAVYVVGLAFLILVGALVAVVRMVVVTRLRNLRRLLELLRSGGRAMALRNASRDEIDDVERLIQALTHDLDDRVSMERAIARISPVLGRHRAPVVLTDTNRRVLAANQDALQALGVASPNVLGQDRKTWANYDAALFAAALDAGWAIAEDEAGPIVLRLASTSDHPVALLEIWPETPHDDEAPEPAPPDAQEAEPAGEPTGAVESPEWMLYATAVIDQIGADAARFKGVLRFDRRLVLARRMVADLVDAAAACRDARHEVDLKSLALIAVWDAARQTSRVEWHTLLEPAELVVASRFQLRALLRRLAAAAGEQAGDGGHVVLFTQHDRSETKVFLGAWASQAGNGVLVDPLPHPPLVRTIAQAHGGGLEVDAEFDISELAENRRFRLPCPPRGTLFVVELARQKNA